MIESIIAALGLLGSGGVYYFMNKRIKDVEKNLAKAEAEVIVANGYRENAEERVIELQKKHSDFIASVKDKMDIKVSELEEKYKKQANDMVQKVINDYEEALKLETEGLENQVAELDEQLGQKLQEITGKNTMYFTCACDRTKQIPCSVDLSSDENYFTCPDCGAVYRIVVNTSTILMSGITNNTKIASMYEGKEIGEVERTVL